MFDYFIKVSVGMILITAAFSLFVFSIIMLEYIKDSITEWWQRP